MVWGKEFGVGMACHLAEPVKYFRPEDLADTLQGHDGTIEAALRRFDSIAGPGTAAHIQELHAFLP
jgi:hypothetical protein